MLLGAAWGAMNWDVVLQFLNQVTAGVSDPILGRDAGFYLFVLPFYDSVFWLLVVWVAISLLAAAAFLLMPRREEEVQADWWERSWDREYADYRPLYVALGALGVVLGWGHYLNMFHLMYSRLGAVAGPGWTDVHVRLPAYWFAVVVTVVASVWLLVLAAARRLHDRATKNSKLVAPVRAAGIPIAAVAVLWFVALQLVPAGFQWLVVEPNEITAEKPYIEHNIEFTRRAFHLDKIEEREFPASAEFTQATAEENQHVLSQVRLWDPRALVQVYKQFQEIRLYYEFADVDIDRYTIEGDYRQVMVSPREMNLENLPDPSQTFVNRHFKYTHGYGLTLAPVNRFTSNGLPDLLVKDLPPKAQSPDLQVARPQIYYGELTDDYVVVNSKEEEFDYPRGQENACTRYDGSGGVQLDSLWRRFVYGWKLGGTRLFLSSYPTDESRILFRRQVRQRLNALAPFLHFDRDPYIVLADGRLYWIIDAYTTSSYYPYSEPFSWWTSDAGRRVERPQTAAVAADYLYGANYVRNSVKAVVDAYEGSVAFYVFDPDTKIDQDSHLAGQLTLWDQRGSKVIRGNVLAIPVDDTLLYVEPIYLQAEAAAYPELRLVAVMQGDRLSYAEGFDEALRGLYGAPTTPSPASPPAQPFDRLARRANGAFDDYLQALSDRRFDKVGEALKELSSTLETLARHASGSERTAGRDQPRGPQTK